jgi:putative tryptophan/tyrosine transport system substrate-binding protein
MASHIGRRKFLATLGGAASWPLAARAQQRERMRRIGVLLPYAADDREGQARLAAFQQALAELGWSDGGNVRIDTRWGAGDPRRATSIASSKARNRPICRCRH